MNSGVQQRWVVRQEPGRGAADEWQRVLAATHLAFDLSVPADRMFTGTVVRTRVGFMDLVECRSTPFTGRRGSGMTGEPGADRFGIQILCRGTEHVRSPGSEPVVLSAGALQLWDGMRPVRLDVMTPFVKRTLVFPRERVVNACPRLAEVESLPALGGLPSAGMLTRYVGAMVAELSEMDDRMRETACDIALELIRSIVEPSLPDARAARRDALRARARRYVRAHLADPRLGPETIARALSVSRRTLHNAFQGSDSTVASLVRTARLARSKEDLADPGGGSVTEIAYRWGFADATHFSQAFKREYGMTPREVRALGTRKPCAEPMV
ncbi:helix-turn-helix domain-containing protein [Amycolatopsis pithecellobii]|uniref:Helix-turn-helix domain-containing protein n=1 Tax=Amycolatopsis pithecellobii TaxID=664692 RepID=A0A6N7Z113_9PSEU|nr:helix-turn-helix domain-containing protein [Amycolatopsis pithecellobii]MTD53184.1 helix-turn-helix domain-containing protein [Amycolatopsis pithecellobii]